MVAFLFDENVPQRSDLARGLTLCTFEVFAVGDPPAPPRGSGDETVVDWCVGRQAVLVTADHGKKNREMMPLLRGRSVRVLLVPPGMTAREFVIQFVRRNARIEDDAARRRACRYRMGRNGGLSAFG